MYAKFCVMRELGWSYQELQDCPLGVYLDILSFIDVENKFQRKKSKNANR